MQKRFNMGTSQSSNITRDPMSSAHDQGAVGFATNDQQRDADPSSVPIKSLPPPAPFITQATAPSPPINQPMNEPFVCEDCGIYVNSLEQLRIHKESPKHAKKAEEKRRIEAFQRSQQPFNQVPKTASVLEPITSAPQPDPCPFKCMIRNKKLNTLSQLEIHLKTTASHAKNLSEEDIKRLLNEGTPAASGPQIAMVQPKTFTCDLCKAKVGSVHEMAAHVCQKETELVEADNTMFKHIV